jgi:Xaa-Pro dipeptidase
LNCDGFNVVALHFAPEELAARLERALAAMAGGSDALLMFKRESMYWLTGYDSFGHCFFPCLVQRVDGDLGLLTHAPDLRHAETSHAGGGG